ncbi:hypothetical protein GCM10010498_20230 [Streptomyces cavourensis]|nr:hypothetical protein GCM10010498_20230 [Streptomyces cavourensis]
MDPQIQFGDARQGRGELLADQAQSGRSGEQGLPSVQDHCHGGQGVGPGVFGQASSRPGNNMVRDRLRPGSPALISMFVDITMVAGQIAPAVNLQNDFAERDRGSCHSTSLVQRSAPEFRRRESLRKGTEAFGESLRERS